MTDAPKAPTCERCGETTRPAKWDQPVDDSLKPYEINLYACPECGWITSVPRHCARHDRDLVRELRSHGYVGWIGGSPTFCFVYHCPVPGCDVWIRAWESAPAEAG